MEVYVSLCMYDNCVYCCNRRLAVSFWPHVCPSSYLCRAALDIAALNISLSLSPGPGPGPGPVVACFTFFFNHHNYFFFFFLNIVAILCHSRCCIYHFRLRHFTFCCTFVCIVIVRPDEIYSCECVCVSIYAYK